MSDTRTCRTIPDPDLTRMPPGIPYIIGNELAERFSFYGMKSILVVFMTRHLLDASGQPVYMNNEQARGVYHLFTAGAYFFPLVGAILSDVLWGKYRTILLISLMYCVGHGCLGLMDVGPLTGSWSMHPFLYAGLILIAMGAGGIKPCVSAHVGDQFGARNRHLLTQVFNWFYFSINLGAAASTFLTPLLLARAGPWAAFGLPGVLMAVATFLFWLGRDTFIHVPSSGWKKFREEILGPDGRRALSNLTPLFLFFVPVFWAIFDQTGSAWVLQAESMDRRFIGYTWFESQVQVVNPILILVLIPVFTYVVYPLMGRFFEPTPLRKIGIGLLLTGASVAISAMIETAIARRQDEPAQALWQVMSGEVPKSLPAVVETAGDCGWDEARIESCRPPAESEDDQTKAAAQLWSAIVVSGDQPGTLSITVRAARRMFDWNQDRLQPFLRDMPGIGWQFLAYFVLTAGEILVSIVCLEFAYTQSPPRMKSFIMGVYFLGVSLGNFAVAAINFALNALRDEHGRTLLEGAMYYWFFTAVTVVTLFAYLVFARRYRGMTFIQGKSPDDRT